MSLQWILHEIALCGIVVLLAQSLAFAWRANVFSLGHHGFFGLGAYAGALVSISGVNLGGPANVAIAVAAGAVAAGIIAAAAHLFLRRLTGDYLAVATLIAAEVAMRSIASWDHVGGAMGYQLPDFWQVAGTIDQARRSLFFVCIIVALNVGFFLAMQVIARSVRGLQMEAVREDSLAAAASGVRADRLQFWVFVASAAGAGAAGGAVLHIIAVIVPSDFSFINGVIIAAYVVFGRARPAMTILAAVVLFVVFETLKLRFFDILGRDFGQVASSWSNVLWGLLLLAAAHLQFSRRGQRSAND